LHQDGLIQTTASKYPCITHHFNMKLYFIALYMIQCEFHALMALVKHPKKHLACNN